MQVRILLSPYDSGHYGERAGRGPDRILERGLADVLRADGHETTITRLAAVDDYLTENGTAFALIRLLAESIRALPVGVFPLILAGNCHSSVGAIAGAGAEGLGLIWFDAHGDFNTPDSTVTGFLDGMGLAMAAGLCWRSLLGRVPGFAPIPARNIIHVGARDLDAGDAYLLKANGIAMVPPGPDLPSALARALGALSLTATKIHLHLDLDVLDGARHKASALAATGGPSAETVRACLESIANSLPIRSCTIASFDPAWDRDDSVVAAAISFVRAILGQA